MDTQALKTVILVSELGNFASAARVLDVDPSSVSRTVAAIEAELGVRLFQRSTRRLAVTEAGERYIRRIAPLVEELEHARDEAVTTSGAVQGNLRLTASVAFMQECIVPHVGEFLVDYPDISLELLPSDTNLDLFGDNIDLAIRLAAAPEGDVISTRLCNTRYKVIAAPAYVEREGRPAHPSELSARECARFALPGFRDQWLFRSGSDPVFEVPVSGRLVTTGALALRQAALNGIGPALLPDWLTAEPLRKGHLIDLFPDYACTATSFDTGAWALYPSRSFLPRKVRVMIDFLRQRLNAAD